jgi:hypothetical protein
MSTDLSMATVPYTVTLDGDSYVVRVDRNLLDRDELNRLLDYLLVQSILRHSQATQDEIDSLADEVKQRAWARLKPLFAPDSAA